MTKTQSLPIPIDAEEALLEAYELQWKAIDLRLERLRTDCERMILEYEVELKQQMYMRECAQVVEQKELEHAQQRAALEQELAERERAWRHTEQYERKHERRDKEESPVEVETDQEESSDPDAVDAVVSLRERIQAKKSRKAAKEPTTTKRRKPQEEDGLRPTVKARAENVMEKELQPKKVVPASAANVVVRKKPTKPTKENASVKGTQSTRKTVDGKNSHKSSKTTTKQNAKNKPMDAPLPSVPSHTFSEDVSLEEAAEVEDELQQLVSQDADYESDDYSNAGVQESLIVSTTSSVERTPPREVEPSATAPRIRFASPIVLKHQFGTPRGGSQVPEPELDSEPSPEPLTPTPKKALKKRKLTHDVEPAITSVAKVPVIQPSAGVTDKTAQAAKILKSKETAKSAVSTKTKGVDSDARKEKAVRGKKANPRAKTVKKKAEVDKAKARIAELIAAQRAEISDMTGASVQNDIATPKVPFKKMRSDLKKKQVQDLAAKRAEFQKLLKATKDDIEQDPALSMAIGKKRPRAAMQVPSDDVSGIPRTPLKKTKTKSILTPNRVVKDPLNILRSPAPKLWAAKKQERAAQAKKRAFSAREEPDNNEFGDGTYSTPPKNGAASFDLRTPGTAKRAPASRGPTGTNNAAAPNAPASDFASRWLNSGLTTRSKKNAIRSAGQKGAVGGSAPTRTGTSFFDAFVNGTGSAIPRLKTSAPASK